MAIEENLVLGLETSCSLSVSVLKTFNAQVNFSNVFQVKVYKYWRSVCYSSIKQRSTSDTHNTLKCNICYWMLSVVLSAEGSKWHPDLRFSFDVGNVGSYLVHSCIGFPCQSPPDSCASARGRSHRFQDFSSWKAISSCHSQLPLRGKCWSQPAKPS